MKQKVLYIVKILNCQKINWGDLLCFYLSFKEACEKKRSLIFLKMSTTRPHFRCELTFIIRAILADLWLFIYFWAIAPSKEGPTLLGTPLSRKTMRHQTKRRKERALNSDVHIKEESLWCLLHCKGSERPQVAWAYAPVISTLFLSDGFIPSLLQLNHPVSHDVVIPTGQQGGPVVRGQPI